MNSKYKSDLKAWLRKYPKPKEQQKHLFQTFEREKSTFEIVKDEVKKLLTEYNIKMHILLQKLTSIVSYELMKICFNLPPDYDFVLDPSHKKKTNAQKEYKAYLIQDVGNEQTQVTIYLNENSYHLANKDILDIFTYINAVAGENVITAVDANAEGIPHPVFNITYINLQKQERIKAIRAANKRTELSKNRLLVKFGNIDIPPALESEHFERNTGDNKESTKIKQLVPTDPFKRNE
jgi:hypothetical protein